jgi:hypothetical protein
MTEGVCSAPSSAPDQTLYRRFFGQRRSLSDDEIAYFLNIDFASHVALVAILNEGDRATVVGGARYRRQTRNGPAGVRRD